MHLAAWISLPEMSSVFANWHFFSWCLELGIFLWNPGHDTSLSTLLNHTKKTVSTNLHRILFIRKTACPVSLFNMCLWSQELADWSDQWSFPNYFHNQTACVCINNHDREEAISTTNGWVPYMHWAAAAIRAIEIRLLDSTNKKWYHKYFKM